MNNHYYNNREKVLARLKEKYHEENSELKKRFQEYYDQNREKILKQNARKNRTLSYEEREKRRIYQRKYYYRRINKSKVNPANIDEGKYIVEL